MMQVRIKEKGDKTDILLLPGKREKFTTWVLILIASSIIILGFAALALIFLDKHDFSRSELISAGMVLAIVFYFAFQKNGKISIYHDNTVGIYPKGRRSEERLNKTNEDYIVLIRKYVLRKYRPRNPRIPRDWNYRKKYYAYRKGLIQIRWIVDEILGERLIYTTLAIAKQMMEVKIDILHENATLENYKHRIPNNNLTEKEQHQVDLIDQWLNFAVRGIVRLTEYWQVLYIPSGKEPIPIYTTIKKEASTFNKFAEIVSKRLHISLIDHTGIYPTIIKPTDLDFNIIEKINAESIDVSKLNQDVFENDENIINVSNGSTHITTKVREFSNFDYPAFISTIVMELFGSILLFWGVPAAFKPDVPLTSKIYAALFVSIPALGLLLLAFYISNRLTHEEHLIINRRDITVETKKLFTRRTKQIEVLGLERIVVVEKNFKFHIEFASDTKRITTEHKFTLDQAVSIKNHILEALN